MAATVLLDVMVEVIVSLLLVYLRMLTMCIYHFGGETIDIFSPIELVGVLGEPALLVVRDVRIKVLPGFEPGVFRVVAYF